MDKKVKAGSVAIGICLLVIAVLLVGIVYFFYNANIEKNNLQAKINELEATIKEKDNKVNELENKISKVSDVLNDEDEKGTDDDNSKVFKADDIKYEITTRKNEYDEEIYAIVKATKDGKSVKKEFEMDALIANTGTMILPEIGNVALVAISGGEGYSVYVYQLINNEIKNLGKIECGADMVEDATYEATKKDEITVVINAKVNSEKITKEFEMDAQIARIEIIDVLQCGKVVLVAESGGEYYAFKAYRLSQNYINGKIQGIVEVGSIQHLFE